jgi:hypothetical protein
MKYKLDPKKMTLKITASGKDEQLILKLLCNFGDKDMVIFPKPIDWVKDNVLVIARKMIAGPRTVTISLRSRSISKEFIQKLLRSM